MKSTSIDVSNCGECNFFWTVHIKKMGLVPHCNFYGTMIRYKLDYSAMEKHPDCKVVSIIVNEE